MNVLWCLETLHVTELLYWEPDSVVCVMSNVQSFDNRICSQSHYIVPSHQIMPFRIQLQRDLKFKKKKSEEPVTPANTMTNGQVSEEVEMLEVTLGMLRCSVCRDRFKEVALTRCFHLFCKECIDENIRNRNRKCPACGEKFGQDDVKTIYFTH